MSGIAERMKKYKKEYKEQWTANHYNLENYKKLYPDKWKIVESIFKEQHEYEVYRAYASIRADNEKRKK